MMLALVDSLLDKEVMKTYISLKELIQKEESTIKPIFTYVISYFGLKSDSTLRSSLSDKLSHMPGRMKKSQRAKVQSSTDQQSSTEIVTESCESQQ